MNLPLTINGGYNYEKCDCGCPDLGPLFNIKGDPCLLSWSMPGLMHNFIGQLLFPYSDDIDDDVHLSTYQDGKTWTF